MGGSGVGQDCRARMDAGCFMERANHAGTDDTSGSSSADSGDCDLEDACRTTWGATTMRWDGSSAARAGQQRGILPAPSSSHGLPDVSAKGLADRIGRHGIGRQTVQQTREGHRAVLECAGGRVDPVAPSAMALAGRAMGPVLEHPTSVFQTRLICHGPAGKLRSEPGLSGRTFRG